MKDGTAGERLPTASWVTLVSSGKPIDRRQRRVLGQVEVLVADRRDGDAHRLRQDHVPDAAGTRQGEGVGGLALSLGHGLDRAPDDLGDVAGRVDTRAARAAKYSGVIVMPPRDAPAVELGRRPAEAEHHPARHEHDDATAMPPTAPCAPACRCGRPRGRRQTGDDPAPRRRPGRSPRQQQVARPRTRTRWRRGR